MDLKYEICEQYMVYWIEIVVGKSRTTRGKLALARAILLQEECSGHLKRTNNDLRAQHSTTH